MLTKREAPARCGVINGPTPILESVAVVEVLVVPAARQEHLLEAPWVAPHAPAPVTGQVSMPGSKSATNRALLLAALSPGASTLVAPLRARDTLLMAQALR